MTPPSTSNPSCLDPATAPGTYCQLRASRLAVMPKILGGKVDYLSMTTARLLGPADIRTLASELDITPTKKLGQNFLHDPNTVRMIITTTQFTDATNRHVLEVGPGLGSLTLGLVTACEKVTAIEIDPRLAARLPRTVAEFAPDHADQLTVSNRDALTVSPQDIDMSTPPTALVANLPYNVSCRSFYTFWRNPQHCAGCGHGAGGGCRPVGGPARHENLWGSQRQGRILCYTLWTLAPARRWMIYMKK